MWFATTSSLAKPLTIQAGAWNLPGSMLRLLAALLPTLLSAMRSRRHLVIENLALRQQLATLAGPRHPDIRPADRVFWILLRRSWSRWAQALAIVRPDAVVRWHRAGSASTGTGCPGAERTPAARPCLKRSDPSSGGWPPRTPGARPASTGNCFASASMSQSAASPDTCVPCLEHREPTPPGRRSSGTTETGSPRWTSSRCPPRCSESFMCFSSSATAGATWSAALSRRAQLLPGLRSNFARPFPSSRRRASRSSIATPSSRRSPLRPRRHRPRSRGQHPPSTRRLTTPVLLVGDLGLDPEREAGRRDFDRPTQELRQDFVTKTRSFRMAR